MRSALGKLSGSSDALWIALGLGCGAVLEFGFRGLAGRWLGPEMFGTFSFLLAVLAFIGTVATLSMGNMLPRYVNVFSASRPELVDPLLSASLRVGVASALAFAALVGAAALTSSSAQYRALGMVALLIPFFVVSELAYATNRAFLLVRRAILQREIIRRGVPIVLIGAFILAGVRPGVDAAVLAVLVGVLAAIGFGGAMLLSRARTPVAGLPARELAVFLSPLVITGFFAQANARMDMVIGASTLSARDLGLYSASLAFPQMLTLTAAVFNFTFLPRASRLVGEGDMEGLRRLFWRTTRNIFLMGLVPLVVLGVGGNRWVVVMFGTRYATEVPVFELLLIANFLLLVTGAVGMAIVASGRTTLYLLPEGIAFVSGAVAQYVLSREYGLVGLAGGTLTTAAVVLVARFAVLHVLLHAPRAKALSSRTGIESGSQQ